MLNYSSSIDFTLLDSTICFGYYTSLPQRNASEQTIMFKVISYMYVPTHTHIFPQVYGTYHACIPTQDALTHAGCSIRVRDTHT